jgi:hypothetical protein
VVDPLFFTVAVADAMAPVVASDHEPVAGWWDSPS